MAGARVFWKSVTALVLALAVVGIGVAQFRWWRQQKELRWIEKVTGAEFPARRSELAIYHATEFGYTGHMKIAERDAQAFVARMKMAPKEEYVALATWGPQAERFKEPKNLKGYIGVYGAIEGKNGWEFAYDPSSHDLWFFVGWHID